MAVRGDEKTPLIRVPIPGPKAQAIIKRDDAALMTTTKTAPIAARMARGCVVEDVDGNRLLDFAAGIGVVNVGHCHPKVVKAVQDQAAQLMHFAGTDYYYDQQARLAERLGELAPVKGRGRKTFFTNSGAEANEAALKIAKAGTGRHRFISFFGAFHGRTMGALSLTASKYIQKQGFFPSMPGVEHVPFPNPFRNVWRVDGYEEPQELANRAIDHIENVLEWSLPPEDLAGLFWEPVQGEGGYVVPPKMFPRMVRKLLDEHGALLVADEVQTGFGRTGPMFGSEHFDVKADIVAVAKAMGNGIPIGAAITRSNLDFEEKGKHSNTYGGNLVACAAGNAVLDVIEEERLLERGTAMGEYMGRQLREIYDDFDVVGDHRGLGLMRAVEFTHADGWRRNAPLRDRVADEAWKRGVMFLGCGRSSLRFIPPLTVSEAQIDAAMDVLRQSIAASA